MCRQTYLQVPHPVLAFLWLTRNLFPPIVVGDPVDFDGLGLQREVLCLRPQDPAGRIPMRGACPRGYHKSERIRA
jgi:hypothetical protein